MIFFLKINYFSLLLYMCNVFINKRFYNKLITFINNSYLKKLFHFFNDFKDFHSK